MLQCPKCDHRFYEEEIIPFDSYTKWREYISEKMHKAFTFSERGKHYVQSNRRDGRILAEWDKRQGYGYVSEARHNLLKRMTYRIGDR